MVSLPRKLRLALGAVKDQTSVSVAKISGNPFTNDPISGIEIAVVKATRHDETPIQDKHVREIISLVSNSPGRVHYLAGKISRRLEKTTDRIVAQKTLMLIHSLLRDGGRTFEQGLRNSRFSGHLRLDLQSFSQDPSDAVVFLHGYAGFIEERMGWFINQAGKLESAVPETSSDLQSSDRKLMELVFYRLPKCQELLHRIMDCFPDGIAGSDPLIKAAFNHVLRESFQVYQTFCDGVAMLVKSFFDFEFQMGVLALKTFKRASLQSSLLAKFFENCKRITDAKNFEFPSIQIISETQVSTMEEFLNHVSSEKSESGSVFTKSDLSSSPTSSPQKPLQIQAHERNPQFSELEKRVEKTEQVEKQELLDPVAELSIVPVAKTEDQNSLTAFSSRWETKISTEWVEFGEENQNSSSSNGEQGDGSSSTTGDLLLLGTISDFQDYSEMNRRKDCSYNPFVDSVNLPSPCYLQLEELNSNQGNFMMDQQGAYLNYNLQNSYDFNHSRNGGVLTGNWWL